MPMSRDCSMYSKGVLKLTLKNSNKSAVENDKIMALSRLPFV